ncbi:unnamed protein product [Anisakis simplex]|uniref:Aromatic-L-amino-acid decarboxylase (inferred by orthology to a human protein) n=1 Tax=Anisakis simplex TaxID=6269 RepID=A0A0M3IY59_ANISI|nr:unnamed protein product [Anisakis simplex]
MDYGKNGDQHQTDIKKLNKNTIELNETPNLPPFIIEELQSTILPMFQQSPKVRAHSFYPGVQSLIDTIVEFGCNILAARGLVTVGRFVECFSNSRHIPIMQSLQDGSPGMLELEMVTTTWVGKAFGLPSNFICGKKSKGGGLQLTTTTEGMFTAIMAARQRQLREIIIASAEKKAKETPYANEEDFLIKNMVAYGCTEAHLSFDFGCRLAKIEDRLISPDADDTMNVQELEQEITVSVTKAQMLKDIANKRTPIFINVTFGSAHSCSFDKIDKIIEIARKYNIWVHVDASYAGNYLVNPSYRSRIQGLENANSICINLHKCLTQSSHTTFFWTTDLRPVKESIPLSQNMLRMLHSDGSYNEIATTASNRYKPLKTYLWLRLYGITGLRGQIETITTMTDRFRKHMTDDGRLEDKTPFHEFGFIVFICKSTEKEKSNDRTYRLCCYILKSGKMNVVLVAPRSVNMIRMSINREHLTEDEIDESWIVLKSLLDDWQAEENRGIMLIKSECERILCNAANASLLAPVPSSMSVVTPRAALNLAQSQPPAAIDPEEITASSLLLTAAPEYSVSKQSPKSRGTPRSAAPSRSGEKLKRRSSKESKKDDRKTAGRSVSATTIGKGEGTPQRSPEPKSKPGEDPSLHFETIKTEVMSGCLPGMFSTLIIFPKLISLSPFSSAHESSHSETR